VLAAASDALVTTGGDALGFLSMDFFSNLTRLSQGQLRIHLKLICGVVVCGGEHTSQNQVHRAA
jgi:hypothetical protein